MKVLQVGHKPIPWWVNQIASCGCGWTVQFEDGDQYAMSIAERKNCVEVLCGTCGNRVTLLHPNPESRELTADELNRDMLHAPLSEDQLRIATGFTNCPRFDESPLKEMFQKEAK